MGTRIISGIIGIAAAFMIIMYGGFIYMLCVTALAVLAWQEYVRAFAEKNIMLPLWLGTAAVIFLVLSGSGGINKHISLFMPAAALVMTVFLFRMVFCYEKFSPLASCIGFTGVFYIGSGFYYIMQLRLGFTGHLLAAGGIDIGLYLIWLTLIGTWASDTFAYFIGFFLGKHKLCPLISPKKTIEGFVGGLIGTVASVSLAGWYAGFPLWSMCFLGVLVAIVATLGDLVESIFKRYTGIKDSGNLIPGHGGVLDRFDSLIFTAPLVYYFYIFFYKYLLHQIQ
ncbi:phosphatidate cytidylyltransferase [Pectinatus haikarae]|uniref:phosphatidate cytidylyltransferase n=1 Tax=Pectinatus haikarae TaxID=349096 RepID=UPI0018C695DE|nr:phosphatidate cytidylyltransferase [Pectinatus haikarae]